MASFVLIMADSADGLVEFKKYKTVNSSKVCGDKLCSEAYEKSAKKGESSRNIKVCGYELCSDVSENLEHINKSSPLGQIKLGVALDLIQCKENQKLAIKKTNQSPACVNLESIGKLREKGWEISEQMQKKIVIESIANRIKETKSEALNNFDVSMTIISDQINNQKYLIFNGNGWHRLHNVEITITGESFSESIRTKTDDRGHLNMPWPIPNIVGGETYNIYATDGIHQYKINIPISPR